MNPEIFFIKERIRQKDGVIISGILSEKRKRQKQTSAAFGTKWVSFSKTDKQDQKTYNDFQKKWFLKLYGFSGEQELRDYLSDKKTILDAGAGLAEKTAWIASMAPHATVLAVDLSEAIFRGRYMHKEKENMIFVQCDIANTGIKDHTIDCVICDQVIMHTENPRKTLKELSRIVSSSGEVFCYWYRKKALPRELLDDFFRNATLKASFDEIWALSGQLTELGKTLSELDINIDVPDMPLLDIKGGSYNLQRFIYWNFIKCFWNPEMGKETSKYVNFDWYSPSNAKRFSKEEIEADLNFADLTPVIFHLEEACYSGRFTPKNIKNL